MDIRREKRLIRFMHANADVGPPKKCLRQGGPVIGPHLQFQNRPVRMQADPVHPLHPANRVMVAQPDRFGTAGMFLDGEIRRQKRGRTMMLRPVELDSAGNPRPSQADQGGLDDRLAINEIVTVGFVPRDMDAPAEFRQDHDLEKFIFQPDRRPGAVCFGVGDPVGKRQRIDFSAAALIDPFFQEHRIQIRRRRHVSRNVDDLSPNPDARMFAHNNILPGTRECARPLIARSSPDGNKDAFILPQRAKPRGPEFNAKTPRRKDAKKNLKFKPISSLAPSRLCAFALNIFLFFAYLAYFAVINPIQVLPIQAVAQ